MLIRVARLHGWWVVPDNPDEDKFAYRVHILPLVCSAVVSVALVVRLIIGG
jgi:hypothetical protein